MPRKKAVSKTKKTIKKVSARRGRPPKNLKTSVKSKLARTKRNLKRTSVKQNKKGIKTNKPSDEKITRTANFHLLRGMKDILPSEQNYWQFIIQKAENLARVYNFNKIETPILEETGLFTKGVGKITDIVEKQMFSFIDQGGDNICLRPETTASVARAYIEHGMLNLPQPVKLYYIGPQFRREKPQAGRLRQFHQFGLEIIGDDKAVIDAQIISFSYLFYKELGIETSIQINSLGCPNCREEYKKILLDFYRPKKRFLCEDCQKRMFKNPLRLLDCKNPECQKIAEEAPQLVDHLCDECKNHFIRVLEYLDELEIPYNLNPHIVRGLDYYTRTIFEIWPQGEEKVGQSALGGGGRYDGLIETLGGQPTPACGVAFGIERTILEMKEQGVTPPAKKRYDVFLAQIGEAAKKECLKIFEELRKEKIKVVESFSKTGLRPQLELANKYGVKLALILGQKELLEGTILIRDMESGTQETVNIQKVAEEVRKRLKQKVKKTKL